MKTSELEVIWPLHRRHYLSLPDPRQVLTEAIDAPRSEPLVATTGRELAARALLAGPDGAPQRVSELLDVSRAGIDRMADADCSIALRVSGRDRRSWEHRRGTRGGGRLAAGGGQVALSAAPVV